MWRNIVDPPNVRADRAGTGSEGDAANRGDRRRHRLAGIDPAAVRPVIADPMSGGRAWYRQDRRISGQSSAVRENGVGRGRALAARRTDAAVRRRQGRRHRTQRGGAVCRDHWADVLPYGLEANRIGIELCLRYAAEQGLVPRVYDVREVFAEQKRCDSLSGLPIDLYRRRFETLDREQIAG